MKLSHKRAAGIVLAVSTSLPLAARAAEHVTLQNGFEMDCSRREVVDGGRVRLFLMPASAGAAVPDASYGASYDASYDASYIDVASDAVVSVEAIPDPVFAVLPAQEADARPQADGTRAHAAPVPTKAEMHTMLARAGAEHNIDEDLLAAVVKAESGGRTDAASRTGARGLMQLMPGTASAMGVEDAFRPEQNIAGGTAYLDWLLARYHDDATLALAAYNAGPGAVDRYHGVPPYRETRAYVARVIEEFNLRKRAALRARAQVASLR